MTAETVDSEKWSKGRWWLALIVVFVVQVSLIFMLAGPDPVPRAAGRPPVITLTTGSGSGWTVLPDPTLFALPNRRGFSGAVWSETPPLNPPELEMSAPSRPLEFNPKQLGGALREFATTNTGPALAALRPVEPQLDSVGIYPDLNFAPTQSTVRVLGPLANRPLLAPLRPKSWPATDLVLDNTIVQVEVAADGRVFSAELLDPMGTGVKRDADHEALKLAQSARFQALSPAAAQQGNLAAANLMRGIFVFQWLTVAFPATNAPLPNP